MKGRLLTLLLLALSCAHVDRVDPALREGSLMIDGRSRAFLSWEAPRGAPLVIALHGRLGTAAGLEKLSGLLSIARREGFTLVLPEGVDRSWHDARDVGPAAKQGVDDVKFLASVIDEFVERRGVDRSRVYVLGMSNGGFMTLTLVCRLADRLAGAASITGGLSTKLQADCPLSRPVPLAFFLGTEDPLVPFKGGQVANDRGEITPAEDAARFFAEKNGCALTPTRRLLPDFDPADGTRVEVQTFGGCAAPVELHVIEGGGHTWPGGWRYLGERFVGKVSRDENASEAAWAFFNGRR